MVRCPIAVSGTLPATSYPTAVQNASDRSRPALLSRTRSGSDAGPGTTPGIRVTDELPLVLPAAGR